MGEDTAKSLSFEGYGAAAGFPTECLVVQGILPNLAKVAPAAGISWFVFEEAKRMMGMDPHS